MPNGLFGAHVRELSDVGWINKHRIVVNVDHNNSNRSGVAFLAFTSGDKSEGFVSKNRAPAFNLFLSVSGVNCCNEINVISPLLHNIYFNGCSISRNNLDRNLVVGSRTDLFSLNWVSTHVIRRRR
jgi:hypothetical protein